MTGWIGTIFILSGTLAIAYKKRFGFMLGIIGNLLWCLRGFTTTQYDLATIGIIIAVLKAFSWWKWRNYVRTTDTVYSGPARKQ